MKKHLMQCWAWLITMFVFAGASVWADTVATVGGTGYATLAEALNAVKQGGTAELIEDVTLTGAWTPIGTEAAPFAGTFNGNGHTITGLSVSSGSYAGLIGVLDGGIVKNVKFADVAIGTTGSDVGAAVGRIVGNGTVSGVEVLSGSVTGGKRVGGVVGTIIAYGTIENCSNAAAVTATTYNVGGIVGTVYNSAVVTGNSNTAATLTGINFAAGIVGNYQIEAALVGEAATAKSMSLSGNTSTTTLENITASNRDLVIYTNGNPIDSKTYVAAIGPAKYATLAAAVAAVPDGGIIEMLVANVDEAFPAYAAAKAFTVRGLEDGCTGIAGTVETAGTYGWSESGVVFEHINWTASFQKRRMSDVTFRNCRFTGTYGVRNGYVYGGTWTFADCVFEPTDAYAVHFDEGQDATVAFVGCTIRGKVNGLTAGYANSVSFAGCTFDGGVDYDGDRYTAEIKMRADTGFSGCTFTEKFAAGLAAEKNKDDNGINIVAGYVYGFDGCAIRNSAASVETLVVRKNLGSGSFAAIDAGTDAKGGYSSGSFVTKDASGIPLAANCQLFDQGNDLYVIGVMIKPTAEGEKTVPVLEQQSDSSVNETKLASVVGAKDADLAAAIRTNTVVEGVRLTTAAETNQAGMVITPAGVQAVVDAAKEKNTALRTAIEAGETSLVTVKVEVVVSPITYDAPAEGAKKISFRLEPKATVTVVTASTTESQLVKVANEMIDQSYDIPATIVPGFRPKSVVHRDDAGHVIETFTGDDILWDEATGTATVIIHHFSELDATDEDCVAMVDGNPCQSLADAFASVSNGAPATIELMTNVSLSASVALAEGQTATFDLNGFTVAWAGDASPDGLIVNSGTLSVSNGTLNAGTGNVFATSPAGSVTLLGGTYRGAFPAVADAQATNSAPVRAAGGDFYVAGPIAPAYWAPGYVAKSGESAAPYHVQDANIYIRNIAAAQRYPWNGWVDITLDVCWGAAKDTARLFVVAYDGGDARMDMTEAKVIVDGVTEDVDCATGFAVKAPEKKTLHLMWLSTEAVAEGQVKEGVHFKFVAK